MSDVRVFALDAVERAGKSVGQGVVAGLALVLPSVDGAHIVSGAWWVQVLVAAGVGGVMGLASLVTSIASASRTGTASLSKTVAAVASIAVQAAPLLAGPAPAVVADPALGEPVYAPEPPAEPVADPAVPVPA